MYTCLCGLARFFLPQLVDRPVLLFPDLSSIRNVPADSGKAARQEAGLSSVQNFKFAGGHTKFGCSISAMDDWIAFIAGLPKSAADADAATVSSGETGRVCLCTRTIRIRSMPARRLPLRKRLTSLCRFTT